MRLTVRLPSTSGGQQGLLENVTWCEHGQNCVHYSTGWVACVAGAWVI